MSEFVTIPSPHDPGVVIKTFKRGVNFVKQVVDLSRRLEVADIERGSRVYADVAVESYLRASLLAEEGSGWLDQLKLKYYSYRFERNMAELHDWMTDRKEIYRNIAQFFPNLWVIPDPRFPDRIRIAEQRFQELASQGIYLNSLSRLQRYR